MQTRPSLLSYRHPVWVRGVFISLLFLCCTQPFARADSPDQLGAARFRPSPAHSVGYRGDGTGRFPGAVNPCLKWYEHGVRPGPDTNILWKTELRGFTQSHPIVVGDRVITLEEPNFVVCLNTNGGKVLWRKECDHLTQFPEKDRQRARKLLREISASYFKAQALHLEYTWLTGAWRYPISGERPRKGNIDDTPATRDRIAQIQKEWAACAFGGTPGQPASPGHGLMPFVPKTVKYDELASWLTDCQVDFGICPTIMGNPTQMMQHGQTQGTPASDGTHVYATFGYGHTVCLDLEGNIVWMQWFPHVLDRAKVLGTTKHSPWPGYMRKGLTGPSPLLLADKLIVTQGYAIRALDKTTGNLLWEMKYGNGMEADDGRIAYRGPAPLTLRDGTQVLVCPQGYIIRLADGKVLCADKPMDMFMVPFGNVHCHVMGLAAEGDVCYFTWGGGAGAIRIVKTGPDRAESRHLWLAEVPGLVQACSRGEGINRGSTSPETFVENAPVYDPQRKRVYVSTHMTYSLWCFDARDGGVLDGVDLVQEQPKMVHAACDGPSNELTDPAIVAGKYIYVPSDIGACFVFDADDIHRVLAGNRVMTQLHRDIALWAKPWSEMKPRVVDRFLFGPELTLANDCHRTPTDPFFQGDRVYVRTIEGMTCIGREIPGD